MVANRGGGTQQWKKGTTGRLRACGKSLQTCVEFEIVHSEIIQTSLTFAFDLILACV